MQLPHDAEIATIRLRRLQPSVHPLNSRRSSEIHAGESVHSTDSRLRSGMSTRGWIGWATASAVCILAAVLAIAFLGREADQANTRPSAEIYFNNPSSIATWTGARSVVFTFIVHNLARKAYHYRYVIYVTGKGNRTTLIADQGLPLDPGQRTTVRQTIRIQNTARFRISVSLAGTTNVIFFWTQAPSLHSAGSKG
jgi:hypothetical protein